MSVFHKGHLKLLLLILFSFSCYVQAESHLLDLNHPSRSEEEKSRDINRKPQEALDFYGIKPDMTVIELFAGGGWYTKLLAPYLEENGKLYVSIGTDRVEKVIDQFGFSAVEPTGKLAGFEKSDLPGYIYDISSIDFEQSNVDAILTFRNAHNLTVSARKHLNKAVFDALKPGGIYGVIDHTRRHMAPMSAEAWRRVDPVTIIHEALQAGFEFAGYSDLHARPEDSLTHHSRHESLVNESDRFTLKFIKPLSP